MNCFKSVRGIGIFWIGLCSEAVLAKESAISLPAIFLCEGTQHRTVLLDEDETIWIISCAMGCCFLLFRFWMVCKAESESEKITELFMEKSWIYVIAILIVYSSAERMER